MPIAPEQLACSAGAHGASVCLADDAGEDAVEADLEFPMTGSSLSMAASSSLYRPIRASPSVPQRLKLVLGRTSEPQRSALQTAGKALHRGQYHDDSSVDANSSRASI